MASTGLNVRQVDQVAKGETTAMSDIIRRSDLFLVDFPKAALDLVLDDKIDATRPFRIVGGLSGGIGTEFIDHGFFDTDKIRVGDYSDFIVEDVVPPSIYDELADFRLRFISWIPVANEQVKEWYSASEHYFKCIEIAYYILKKNRVDVIVGASWPHVDLQIALFVVARLLGVKTVFLNANYLFDRNALTFGSDPFNLAEDIQGWENVQASPVIKDHIDYLKGDTIKRPEWITGFEDELVNEDHNLKKWVLRLTKDTLKRRLFEYSGLPIKINAGSFSSKTSWPNNFQANNLLWSLHKKNKLNRRYFDAISSSEALKKEDVCFFAPYQPEAISNLYAGQFERIEWVLEILFKSLPECVSVRYREHPSTFLGSSKGALSRDPGLYDRLRSRYPRLKFERKEVTLKESIDSCAAVATIGGSVGYEALARGVPVILFGTVWYSNFSGVFAGPEMTPRKWEELKTETIDPIDLAKQATTVLTNSCDDILRTADQNFSCASNLNKFFFHIEKKLTLTKSQHE